MFKENTTAIITERVAEMDTADKKQLLRFIEMQAAYKRAQKMKGSVKKNAVKMEDLVAIVKKVRGGNGAKKK